MTRKKLTAVEREARRSVAEQRRVFLAQFGFQRLPPRSELESAARAYHLALARASLRRRRKELRELAREMCGDCYSGEVPLRFLAQGGWSHGAFDCAAGPIHDAVRRLK